MYTTLTIKTEKRTRDKAKKAAERLGIPLTTIVNALLKEFAREQSITFSVHPIPRPEKIAEWNKMGDDMDAHPEKYKSYSTEEFLALMEKGWAKADKKRAAKVR